MRVQRIVQAIKYLLSVTALVAAMFTVPSAMASSIGEAAPSCWVHVAILDSNISNIAADVIRLLPLAACWIRLWPRALRAPVM